MLSPSAEACYFGIFNTLVVVWLHICLRQRRLAVSSVTNPARSTTPASRNIRPAITTLRLPYHSNTCPRQCSPANSDGAKHSFSSRTESVSPTPSFSCDDSDSSIASTASSPMKKATPREAQETLPAQVLYPDVLRQSDNGEGDPRPELQNLPKRQLRSRRVVF